MKYRISALTALLSIIWLTYSCDDGSVLMKNSTGKPGELVVVMGKEYWESKAGDTIQYYLSQPQLGLPQVEPILTVTNIPPEAFKAFETTRNLVVTKISPTVTEAAVTVQKEIFSKSQLVVSVQAPDVESFVKIFSEKSDYIIAAILQAEKRRLMEMYAKPRYRSEPIHEHLMQKHNYTLNVPKGYDLLKDTSDFVWIAYDAQLTTQGIAVYSFPYESDSTFTTEYLLHKRDSVMKLHIPGPTPGSYMTTEHQVPALAQSFRLNGNYTVEIRGLWRVEGDFMGGPFVSLSSLDLARKRVVTAEGFLYSPKYDKRDYLRQLEAVIYSLTFNNQDINDKLNKQYNFGETETEPADSVTTR